MESERQNNTARLTVRCQLTRPEFSLDVDLSLPSSGITAIFGHSGSGKTTLLRVIAGLERESGNKVYLGHTCWQDSDHYLPTYRRRLGVVFQEASLFPHLTAEQNLQYAIKRADEPVEKAYIDHVVELLGIGRILSQYPAELSGGEAQRVAIARALLIKPKILLMDEPLASLDDARKQEILPYLESLHADLNLPILYVSHSMQEVARLADHAVVLDQGKVVAQGDLMHVFSRLDLPENIHQGVVLPGKVTEVDEQWHLAKLGFDGGSFWLPSRGIINKDNVRVQILAKDVALALSRPDDTSVLNKIQAKVVELKPDNNAGMTLVKLALGTSFIIAQITQKSATTLELHVGQQVWALIKTMAIVK